jgi:hypothetical protein
VAEVLAGLRAANARLWGLLAERDELIAKLRLQVADAGELREQVERLRREVADLAARVKQNSKNSSRPPSSDGLGKPAPKSLRKRTGRKPGRPEGQPGATMELTGHPDHVVRHEPGCCGSCGAGLSGAWETGMERRQRPGARCRDRSTGRRGLLRQRPSKTSRGLGPAGPSARTAWR